MTAGPRIVWAAILLTCLQGGAGPNATTAADEGLPASGNPARVEAQAPPVASANRVRLNESGTVTLDREQKRLLLKSQVVLREGVLEMFLCRAGTKEHESILAIDSEAYVIHAGLLALGAQAGEPVRFDPDYVPPRGQLLDVVVSWTDAEGQAHREPAQSWVRHVTRRYYVEPLSSLPAGFQMPEETELRYDERRQEIIWFGPMTAKQRDELLALSDETTYRKAIHEFYTRSQTRVMDAQFVFTGSGFHVTESGQRHYLAESGNIICVANFSDAMIDVAMQSTASNDGLMFEPYTERVPPLGTEVIVELIPRLEPSDRPPKSD